MKNIPSYIKDTTHFLQILDQYTAPLPEDSILVTLDVSSLYTNIPHHEAISTIQTMLDKDLNKSIPTQWILKLLDHVLTKNAFQFDGQIYQQTLGISMGTRAAPSIANIFMDDFETKLLTNYHLKPIIWKRFIDDIFMVWTHGPNKLESFITYINSLHETIKFTHEWSTT